MNSRTLLGLLALLTLPGLAAARSVEPEAPFERTERQNPWLDGRNAAGLRQDSVTRSVATLTAESTHGGLRDLSDPERAWSAAARVATLTHWERLSLRGSFGFDHASGRGMCGSMFLEPGFYPIDVLEFTPGRKDLQRYTVAGGFSLDLGSRWRIGAGIDFASANYAKRKDLRHANYRLDLTVAPGAMCRFRNGAVGFDYRFSKNSERVRAEEAGASGFSYYALLDKGLMRGAWERWSGSGTHLDEAGIDGLPLREVSHGAAVQLQWGRLFVEVEYLRSQGVAGEKQTEWFRFPSHAWSVRGALRVDDGSCRERMQFVRLQLDWRRTRNDETLLEQLTENGVATTRVIGQTAIFERTTLTVNPEYEVMGRRGELRAGVGIGSVKRFSTLIYPSTVAHRLIYSRIYLDGRIRLGRRFDLFAQLAFRTGSASESQAVLDPDLEMQQQPAFLADCYALQNEYQTATRITAAAALRCHLPRGFFVEAGIGWQRGVNLQLLPGANRWHEHIQLGYNF